jgi:hypothetical protein
MAAGSKWYRARARCPDISQGAGTQKKVDATTHGTRDVYATTSEGMRHMEEPDIQEGRWTYLYASHVR